MAGRVQSEVGELFRLHGAMVYRRALRLLGRKEDADEATQEVFIRVMRSMSEFEGRSSVTTWLYQVTTNYCLNLMRDRGRRRQLFQENVTTPGGGLFEPTERASTTDQLFLRRLLAEADEQQAKAAVYVYFDGLSHEEAAELLGVSKRTVGNLIDRFLAWAQKQSAVAEPVSQAAPRPEIKAEKKAN
jgi:RNA polymerase sigma-70 factor (ECF subfamily)